MIVYRTMPIDHWGLWRRISDLPKENGNDFVAAEEGVTKEEAELFLHRAQLIAKRHLHWEGDIREGAYIAPVPLSDSGEVAFIVAWKQDNNGDTFIASPVRLQHLDNDENVDSFFGV